MPAIVTNKFRIHNAKQFVEAFDEVSTTSGAVVSDSSGLLNTNMYLFIGKVTAWAEGDSTPPTPTDAVANTHYENWRDMIAAKKITSSDVSHVIPRKNWTNNTNYFAFTHTEADLFSQNFYVMTGDYNVYKCLSNSDTTSGGAVATTSIVKPTGTGTSIVATTDGYKWKFMYQIAAADALKFVTPNYIPVDTVRRSNGYLANTYDNAPAQVQFDVETAVAAATGGNGAIEVVHMTTRGLSYHGEVSTVQASPAPAAAAVTIASGASFATDALVNSDIYFTSGTHSGKGGTITDYNSGTKVVTFEASPVLGSAPSAGDAYVIGPKVVISGDGHGANARATVNSTGGINAVTVIAGGNNYSNASITVISNTSGISPAVSAATLTPIVGPAGGHGGDATKELGGYYVLTNARLEYSESNNFTTNNDFRKVGLLAQPKYANGDFATASVVDQASTIVLSSWNGTVYAADELVTGATSGATGRVVDFIGNNTLRVTDIIPSGNSTTAGYNSIYGYFTNTEVIAANTSGNGGSGASATANGSGAVTGGDLTRFSGEILYVENRSPVTRASDQIEDVKLIIEF